MQKIVQTIKICAKKASRTNSTFVFLPAHKPKLKKPKELFYISARSELPMKKLTLETEKKELNKTWQKR
jgi:hypothetical protein